MEEKLFGKNTNIFVDYWLEDEKELLEMNRECTQRVSIVDRWVKEGMTEHDVGIMADIDEVKTLFAETQKTVEATKAKVAEMEAKLTPPAE